MPPRRTRLISANPFLIWTELALKTSEMLFASAQVISHRTSRMANADAIPNARDQKEFILMGQEKIEAAAESALAMAIRMASINQQLAMLTFKQMMSGASGMFALAISPTLALSGKHQAKLMRDAMASTSTTASNLSGSMARLAQHGLKPIHSRATGNARRLSKIKI